MTSSRKNTIKLQWDYERSYNNYNLYWSTGKTRGKKSIDHRDLIKTTFNTSDGNLKSYYAYEFYDDNDNAFVYYFRLERQFFHAKTDVLSALKQNMGMYNKYGYVCRGVDKFCQQTRWSANNNKIHH